VYVTGINVQRSVEIALNDRIPCGNVSIPPNKAIPNIGDIIEVRYLYAMPGSNALYQPVFMRLRDDISCADDVDQLKFKKEED
jgi:bifunctional non-homologous end joining protein LigD